MRVYTYFWYVVLLVGFVLCGIETNAETNVAQCENGVQLSAEAVKKDKDAELIRNVYEKFVFATVTEGNDSPEDYFTSGALKKLQADYEFDCEDGPCYAYYALRTSEQDSKPGSEDVSRICNIDYVGDGWYIVSYLDMGWSGKTRVMIADGKIDSYERLEQ